jgi:two-component system, cell cycle response regulator DivK
VLIVDDHRDACEMYAVYLASSGFDARPMFEPLPALHAALELRPAAIITDLAMPDFDGWEFMRRLRADARTRDIPVVMVSGHADQATQERAEREGCARFFAKPCIPPEIEQALRELLGMPPVTDLYD